MIPLFMRLHIRSSAKRSGFGLWIPLFLVWILLLALFALVLPFLALAELILSLTHYYIPVIRIAWYPFVLIAAARGTEIHVSGKNQNGKNLVDISII